MTNYKQKIAELMKADNYADTFIYCGKELRENRDDLNIQKTATFIFQCPQGAHIEIEGSIYDYSKSFEFDEIFD